MRYIIFIFITIFIFFFIYGLISIEPDGYSRENITKGERLGYEVRFGKLKVGNSGLVFHGEEKLGDKSVYHITFSTEIGAFKDVEELYGDKVTFLPVLVQRTLRRFGTFTTKITETYDQENFKVDVQKKSKLRNERFTIEKDAPIHNAILLTYYYRTMPLYDSNERRRINLPTVDFEVMYKGEENLQTPLGELGAHSFTSEPQKFKLWLSKDDKRMPLKIETPNKVGYSLVITAID